MALRHIALWEPPTSPLVAEVDAIARANSTTAAQVVRAALAASLPRMRAGELRVPAPRRVGRPRRTDARTDR